jgi:RIO kinase 1
VVRMLCAGIVHGDLSEFNILVGSDGPVIIDLPQAVDAAGNNHAKDMLARDVNNLANYFGQFAPELLKTQYAKEIWALYERGDLKVDSVLTGRFAETNKVVDMQSVMREIKNAEFQENARLKRLAESQEESQKKPAN